MKKLVIVFLLFISILAYGCSTEEPVEQITTPLAEDVQEFVTDDSLEQESVSAEPEPVVEEEFQIIHPQLTYEGAYNGPLYGTSEQVGAASMDSYFENLDRNGINFFIGMFGISGQPSADTLLSDQGLGEVIDAAQKHPYRIIPFFNPGIGGEEVERYLGEE